MNKLFQKNKVLDSINIIKRFKNGIKLQYEI